MAMSTLGVNTIKKHEEYYLRDGNVCFLVENTVFRLHRYFFERESDFFREKLNPSTEGEDGSLQCPYIIHNVKSYEFAQFIWVWYKPRYSFSKQETQTWLTILRLATLWGFPEVRRLAIDHLEKMKFEPIDKIKTYKEYAIENELLLPAYVSLCTSPKLPSPEEGRILSMETVLTIARARERLLLSASERGYKTPTAASLPEDVVNALVAELFGLSLQSNDQHVRLEGQAMNNASDNLIDSEVVTLKQPDHKKGKQKAENGLLQDGVNSATGPRERVYPKFKAK